MTRDLFIGETTPLPMTRPIGYGRTLSLLSYPSILLSLYLCLKIGIWDACGLLHIDSFCASLLPPSLPAKLRCALCFVGLVILNIHYSPLRSVVAVPVFNDTDN